jgi:hypothetical protein
MDASFLLTQIGPRYSRYPQVRTIISFFERLGIGDSISLVRKTVRQRETKVGSTTYTARSSKGAFGKPCWNETGMRKHRQSRDRSDAQAPRRTRKTPKPGEAGCGSQCASTGMKRRICLMDETEADRPAQAADRRKDRPEERSPRLRVTRKRKPKPMDRSGNRVQQGSMAPPSGEVMKRAIEGRKRSLFLRE